MKCVFEGMEESGSEGLEPCLQSVRETFFGDVDGTCISDNYWLGTKRPCLTFGIRGAAYFAVEIRGGSKRFRIPTILLLSWLNIQMTIDT
mmetsp:Transcript_10366/g.8825  ORF Transcript_10366/g.8825 Transcript_10366/m.8825 type:complete len:90 (-) Transcript_10366:106-375(-)